MDENNKNNSTAPFKPHVISNPGLNEKGKDEVKQKVASKLMKQKKVKRQHPNGTAAFLVTRLEGFSFAWLSWALGLMIVGAVWFAFDKAHYNIGNFALQTNWMPKMTATIALVITILMIVKICLNWKQFKKLIFLPQAVAQISIIPIIVIVFGEVLMQSASSSAANTWIAGVVFYGLGALIAAVLAGWFIYICILTFVIQKTPLTKINGIYLMPLSGIGFALYANTILVQDASILLWIFWVITLILGGFGVFMMMYRYLVLNSKDSETMQNYGYIYVPLALLIIGFSQLANDAKIIASAHSIIFLLVLLGMCSLGFITIYFLMIVKNLCMKDKKTNESRYSQKISNSLLPLAVIALAAATLASVTQSSIGYELAQFVIVQLVLLSVFVLYTVMANSLQAINALTGYMLKDKIQNKYLKMYL